VTVGTSPNCLCGLPSFQLQYSATGFSGSGSGPGWYIRNRDNTFEPTFNPRKYNGSCLLTDVLCDADPRWPYPARPDISLRLNCENIGGGIYQMVGRGGYGRYYKTSPPTVECIRTGYSRSSSGYSCSPFYMELIAVDTIYPNGTSTACDGSSASLNWYITE
jgi:hypothetical protein